MNPVEIAALDALDLIVVVDNERDTLSIEDKGVPLYRRIDQVDHSASRFTEGQKGIGAFRIVLDPSIVTSYRCESAV
jgi:hypothetical protein